jgi:hypothetical protein
MHVKSLEQAPSANDYLKELQHDESLRDFQPVPAGQVKLTPGGLLAAGDYTLELADNALDDLAKLARIPVPYFQQIDPELRAVNFNKRLPHFLGSEEVLAVTISNDKAVHRVERPRFGQLPPSQAIEAILEAVPAASISNNIRVIEYERDRRLDVAVIAPALEAQPRPGDIAYGGVHLTIEDSGAAQVGPESFRLACSNGAMARVCAGGQHRLRRGMGSDSERKFIASLREFARTAWRDWEHVKRGLEELATQPLDRGDIGHIIHGLRQSPFFISGRAAGRVEEQLRGHGGDLNFYDLHNAITYVGTHDSEVLPQYRYRLRLGAGQLARGRVGVCHECRRLMIGAQPSLN